MPNDHNECAAECSFCGRPKDNFGHLHMELHITHQEVVMCLPCIASLARESRGARRAYDGGGAFFDKWAQQRMGELMKRAGEAVDFDSLRGLATEMPDGLRRQLEDIFNNLRRDVEGDGDGEA